MATAGVPLWSTTAASNSTADPAVNMAEGMAPSAVNDSVRALMSSVANWRNDLYGITTGGTSTALTVATGSTFATAAAMSGAIFTIIPHATSGASATLAVDGLTARALNIATGVAIPTGALLLGTPYLIKYVHATTEFIVMGALDKSLLTALDIINGTSLASIATDDTLPLYDLSATANRRMLVSDFLKVVNALTADASPDAAADYVMTYDASAAAAKKVLLSDFPGRLGRGYIDGCTISNGTDATNDINIAAGVCRDSTNAVDITVPALAGKQLDANWAPGASAGMRNSAAGITDTTYHLYAVRTAASATADIYAHTSTTVATVITALQAESGGTSYVYARRIGSIVRTSAAIKPFVQFGDRFRWLVQAADITATNPGTSAVTRTVTVPTGVVVVAEVAIILNNASNNYNFLATSLDETDTVPGVAAFTMYTIAGQSSTRAGGGVFYIKTNTSAQFRTRQDASGASDVTIISTNGWIDTRGRDA